MLPDWVDRTIQRCIATLRQLRKQGTTVERIRGRCSGSGEPIEVLASDRTTTVDYLLRRLPIDRMEYAERRRLSGKALRRTLRDCADVDLTIIRRDATGGHGVPAYWRIPDCVISIIDLDPAAGGAEPGYGNADCLRRIQKHGLDAIVSHDRRELSDFVQNAYIPHVRSRFGDLARPHSELVIARAFRSGGLLWVHQDGDRLAGLVYSVAGDVIRSRVAAPVSNSELATRVHAVSATKKFLIDYAVERGYKSIDLGKSRPQLSDGVLRHKKRWGARLVVSPDEHTEYHLSWPVFTPTIAQWLCTTPLVVRDNGSLAGLTALAQNESPEACQRRLSRLWSPGLARIIVLSEAGRSLGINEVNGTRVTWRPQ